MESKVTKIAGELVRPLHSPRVLNYATPESRPPFVPGWLKGEWWCPALRTVGMCMIVFGVCVRPSLLGLLTVVVGLMSVLLVEIGRALRELGR